MPQQNLAESAANLRFANQEKIKPVGVVLENRVKPVSHWIDVARVIVNWLIDNGKLTHAQLPVSYAGIPHRFFVASDRSSFYTATDRNRARDLGNGMFLNTQAGADLLLDNCRLLLQRCGVAPETVRVHWE